MKKIMFMAAAAIAVLAGCNKGMETVSSEESITFEKGQTVTLNVIAGATETRVGSQLESTSGDVYFRWQAGDTIRVTVNGVSEPFFFNESTGTNSATFTGSMPAGGDIFSVQYPYTEPDLATQTYSSTEPIPHDMMKFADDSCSLASPTFTLNPKFAALRLNLYGTAQTISEIVVTNTTSSADPKPSYTLNISPAVTLPAAKADSMAFFIVVPAGDWNFSAELFDNAATPASICSFEKTSTDKYFTAKKILNMPAKKVGKFYPGTELEGITIGSTVWAPVNCGYSSTYTYGLLYQWGRKYGCGYNDGSTYTETLIQTTSSTTVPIASTDEDATVFYKITSSPYDWLATRDDTRWNSGSEADPVKTSNDPCPTGWRVPTLAELNALKANKSSWITNNVDGDPHKDLKGYWFSGGSTYSESVPRVFLPVAGMRMNESGNANSRGYYGNYWSSSVNGTLGRALYFRSTKLGTLSNSRATGFSIRCVQE